MKRTILHFLLFTTLAACCSLESNAQKLIAKIIEREIESNPEQFTFYSVQRDNTTKDVIKSAAAIKIDLTTPGGKKLYEQLKEAIKKESPNAVEYFKANKTESLKFIDGDMLTRVHLFQKSMMHATLDYSFEVKKSQSRITTKTKKATSK